MSLGELDGAIDDETRALELGSGGVPAFSLRAYARQWSGDRDGALRDVEEALRLDPPASVALALRGKVAALEQMALDSNPAAVREELLAQNARRAGNAGGEVEHSARFAELAPGLARAHCAHAEALCMAGRPDEAIAAATSALAIAPADGACLATHAFARAYSDPRGALEEVERSIALAPVFGFHARARIHQIQKDNAAALADLDESLARYPTNPAALLERGAVRANRNDLVGANADFTQALELIPGCADAYRLRAIVRRSAGDERARFDQGIYEHLQREDARRR
jgi:tetratricopeptide (TPR) repeat protein